MCSILFTFDACGFKMPLSRVLREDHVNTNNAQSVLFKICALAGQIGLRAGQRDRGSKCVNVPQNAGRVAAMSFLFVAFVQSAAVCTRFV